MKKILALILTAATAISIASIGLNAAATFGDTKEPTPTVFGIVKGDGAVVLAGGVVFINEGEEYIDQILVPKAMTVAGVTLVDASFKGPSASEDISYSVKYDHNGGSHSGIPKGVNGEELFRVRISFDRDLKMYVVILKMIKNPTVEIFTNVEVKVKIVTTIGNLAGTVADQTHLGNKTIVTDSIVLYGGKFEVQNARYTYKDVYKNAKGKYIINASDERPVVDAQAFEKAWGQSLSVNYPNYTIFFPNVKNQNIALNLEADVKTVGTVGLGKEQAILTLTMHDVYAKDDLEIYITVRADAQGFKGQTFYIYELNADGKPTKEIAAKVTISTNGEVVIKVPAGTRLAASGDTKMATYGIYAEKQTLSPGTTGGGNPASGASDVVNAATAFAAVTLAAAGFVALKKASK